MHQALAAQLLYRALLGNDHWKHRDTDTFRRALLLPCRNGFNLTQVRLTCIVGCLVGALTLERKAILMFQGGSERLLCELWTTHINSFDCLEPHLNVLMSASVPGSMQTFVLDGARKRLEDVFVDFLQGKGVPLPEQLAEISQNLSCYVDQTKFDEAFFCPRMFHVAATGCNSTDSKSKLTVRVLHPVLKRNAYLLNNQ